MKSRAAFTCQLSYSGYSYLLSGIPPGKNRKFFIQFANYICHAQAAQGTGKHSEACGRNLFVEDGELHVLLPHHLEIPPLGLYLYDNYTLDPRYD